MRPCVTTGRRHLQGSDPLGLLHSVLSLQLQDALWAADAEGEQAAGVVADIWAHLGTQQADLLGGLLIASLPASECQPFCPAGAEHL